MILNPKAWWTYLRSSGDNFHTVVPGRIFRGATPSPENLKHWYYKYGIRTWIDLRQVDDWDGQERTTTAEHAHFDDQVATCRRLGIERVWIPISDREPTSDENIERVLEVLRNRSKDGIFIACKGGRHRAGEMVAIYGQRVLGWSEDEVKKSLKKGGFYASGHREFAKRLEQLLGFTLALLLTVLPAAGQTTHPFIRPDQAAAAVVKESLTTRSNTLLPVELDAVREALPQKPFDRSYWLPFGLVLASSGTDWHSTHGALARGGREANVVFRTDEGRDVRWAANVGATGAFLGYTAWLEHKGHRRLARVLLYTLTALRSAASVWNYTRRR